MQIKTTAQKDPLTTLTVKNRRELKKDEAAKVEKGKAPRVCGAVTLGTTMSRTYSCDSEGH